MAHSKRTYKESKMANEVFRYETLLSRKMVDQVKTKDLRKFETEVNEYCKEQKSLNWGKIKSEES